MSGVEMIEHGDNYQGKRFSKKLQYISLPNNDNNLKKYYSGSNSGVIDSVFINSKGILKMYELGSTAKYLHIGEGIDSIYVNDARCSGFKKFISHQRFIIFQGGFIITLITDIFETLLISI